MRTADISHPARSLGRHKDGTRGTDFSARIPHPSMPFFIPYLIEAVDC
ncbi:hypothetical protein KOEU_23210 [Komagataeibacter europaeus]|uniref:Uncharacterized protein n=1 Tax=Komagataeibacter europaeus TaxID=33995 RepID=A0A0M0EH26_KOMEU|nr:hypothetical protein KOEU_23210 [Komagataeibacter europaeus]